MSYQFKKLIQMKYYFATYLLSAFTNAVVINLDFQDIESVQINTYESCEGDKGSNGSNIIKEIQYELS